MVSRMRVTQKHSSQVENHFISGLEPFFLGGREVVLDCPGNSSSHFSISISYLSKSPETPKNENLAFLIRLISGLME